MKKIYLTFFASVFVLNIVNSQNRTINKLNIDVKQEDNFTKKIKTVSKAKQKSMANPTSRWFDYGDAMNNYLGTFQSDSSEILSYPLFPDSTLKYNFSNGLFNTFHSIGNLLQATDTLFNYGWYNGEMKLLPTSTYKLDSISTELFYFRNLTNVTDSLIINVGVNPTAQQSGLRVFNPNVFFFDNFGDSVVRFRDFPYNSAKNEMGTIQNTKRFAIALDSNFLADTTSYGSNIIQLSTASLPQINAGGNVYLSMSFKPGFTWNLNSDTLNTKNYIRYLHYKEQKSSHDNTIRYYRDDSTGVDFNRNYFVNTNIRYNNATTFNNRMYPRNIYSKTFNQDQFYFQYKISSNNAGLVEVGLRNLSILSNVNVYPNPAIDILNVTLENTNPTTIKVYNMNGQLVFNKNVVNENNVSVDFSEFSSGIYSMQILNNEKVITKKVIKK